MARASTITKLPLDTFARIIGLHPLHFNQVFLTTLAEPTVCGTPLVQAAWQEADRTGREEIAQAIALSEDMLENELGFRLLPTWEVAERVNFISTSNVNLVNATGINARGMWQAVKTSWGYLLYGGRQAKSVVRAAAAVVYSDTDGDGYTETATITVPTTVTDIEEIALYYPGTGGDDTWEIKPVNVTIAGGNAVITCRREQLVLWNLQEAFQPRGLDGLDNANFLTTADVYRRYNDPSLQVRFAWEPLPSVCDCGLSTCAICSHYYQYGCTFIRDSKPGYIAVTPATWNANDEEYTYTEYSQYRQPEKCQLWYRAGYTNTKLATPNLTMDGNLARAVSYLAVTLLDRPMCHCHHIDEIFNYWRTDFAFISRDNNYRVDPGSLRNPFGTTRAAQYAWRLVQKYKLGESVAYA